MKYRSILALGLCLATMHLAAMEEQMKTDYSQGEENPLIVTTTDEVEFKLSSDLIKKSALLGEFAELDITGPVKIDVSAKSLGNLLELVKQDLLAQDLSLDNLITALKGIDYLGLTMNDAQKEVLSNKIAEKLSLNKADLDKLFNTLGIPETFQKLVIGKMFAKKLKPDKQFLETIYAYPNLSEDVKRFVIKEFIKSRDSQLVQIVGIFSIHTKRCAELGLDEAKCAIVDIRVTAEDKDLHNFIKKLIGDADYKVVEESLKEEYPE